MGSKAAGGILPLNLKSGLLLMSSLVSSRLAAHQENSCEPASVAHQHEPGSVAVCHVTSQSKAGNALKVAQSALVSVRLHPARHSIATGCWILSWERNAWNMALIFKPSTCACEYAGKHNQKGCNKDAEVSNKQAITAVHWVQARMKYCPPGNLTDPAC